ncbi:MAG: chemotaxis-specific protein-glutamate methyltransferase CheB [Cyanobacteria bacterium J06634_6]
MIKVAIANDTLVTLEALRRVIATNAAYKLIWTARDGADAVERCTHNTPDLILMDLSMPGLDGVEATKRIMARSPCAILIVTASINSNTARIFEAMGHGALDVVATPVLGPKTTPGTIAAAAQPLLTKMATVSAFIGKSIRRSSRYRESERESAVSHRPRPLIVIGASTGGPKAIAQIVSHLPATLSAGVVVIQHIDQQFSSGFADWLNIQSQLPVRIAKAGEHIQPGQILVAGTNEHLVMKRDRTLAYMGTQSPTVYRPSVDVFFRSVAQHWPSPGQAVLLTGMGQDGAQGLHALQTTGWQTIAESKDSCVVYGMPRAAVELGAADQVLSVSAITKALINGLPA